VKPVLPSTATSNCFICTGKNDSLNEAYQAAVYRLNNKQGGNHKKTKRMTTKEKHCSGEPAAYNSQAGACSIRFLAAHHRLLMLLQLHLIQPKFDQSSSLGWRSAQQH
jgi:hypothetical protein